MKDKFSVETDIAVGNTGDFEVTADGGAVFSKRKMGRFPNPGEVEDLVETLLAGK